MNAKFKGRAVVLVVLLALLASVPVLADVGLPNLVRTEVIDSGDIYEQYQWVMQQAEAGDDANWELPPGPGRPGDPVPMPKPYIPSGIAYEQYQEALKQMELDIQNAVPNSDGGWKPDLKPLPLDDSSVAFDQYLWALQEMEKSIQEAVPNE